MGKPLPKCGDATCGPSTAAPCSFKIAAIGLGGGVLNLRCWRRLAHYYRNGVVIVTIIVNAVVLTAAGECHPKFGRRRSGFPWGNTQSDRNELLTELCEVRFVFGKNIVVNHPSREEMSSPRVGSITSISEGPFACVSSNQIKRRFDGPRIIMSFRSNDRNRVATRAAPKFFITGLIGLFDDAEELSCAHRWRGAARRGDHYEIGLEDREAGPRGRG